MYRNEFIFMKKQLRSAALRIIQILPVGTVDNLTKLALQSAGKGWDSGLHHEVKVFARALRDLNLHSIHAVDVGANVGDWSLELLKYFPAAQITAFEPSHATYQDLVQNISKSPNIIPVNMGCGNQMNSQTLYSNELKSGMASLSQRKLKHLGIDFKYEELVTISRLDHYFSQSASVIPNVLKIDVEGHELQVLEGAGDLLDEIRIIQFEFGGTNIDSRTYFRDYWEFLTNKSFRIYRMSPRGLIHISRYSEVEEFFSFTNFIALKN
jgi:FkbM family methyltransferase